MITLSSSAVSIALIGLVVLSAALRPIVQGSPAGGEVLVIPPHAASIVLAGTEGEILGYRGIHHAGDIAIENLPPYIAQAFIAIEDHRFMSHPGIDPIGIARAAYVNFRDGQVREGASTITQQLARNLFLTRTPTLERKIQEAMLALRIELQMSKQEILQTYLNRVYFGSGAYGVKAAARVYFGKSAEELTLDEAALLAGFVKAPTTLGLDAGREDAVVRAKLVLNRMSVEGYITQDEIAEALKLLSEPQNEANVFASSHTVAPYLLDWIAASLDEVIESPHGSLFVETTLDSELQKKTEETLVRAVEKAREKMDVSQAAAVVLDNDGAVRAMVGGVDHERSQYNRAVQARRQPGSTFKPFIYLVALQQGLHPSDYWSDRPIDINGWQPANYTGTHRGSVTLDEALTRSINSVAVDVARSVGIENVARMATTLGIQSPMRAHPSLALGTSEVTLVELTGAYATLANQGIKTEPYAIKRVLDGNGRVLFERQTARRERVVDAFSVRQLNKMLTNVVEHGTGRRAAIKGMRVAGKTGTNQDYRDAWFMGFSSTHTTGIWVGNDDFSPMNKVTGGALPAEIWREIMIATVGTGSRRDEVVLARNQPALDGAARADQIEAIDPFEGLEEHHIPVPASMRGILSGQGWDRNPSAYAVGYREATSQSDWRRPQIKRVKNGWRSDRAERRRKIRRGRR